MKPRNWTILFAMAVLWSIFPAACANAADAVPTSVDDATKRVGEQGFTDQAIDYQSKFLTSVWKTYHATVTNGIAAKGKANFEIYFVIEADGRITNTILADPEKNALGRYVAARMLGVQAAKPPKAHWVVSISQESAKASPVRPHT